MAIKTLEAGENIGRGLAVVIDSGKYKLAGDNEVIFGIAMTDAKTGDSLPAFVSDDGSGRIYAIASAPVAVGDRLYADAAGKLQVYPEFPVEGTLYNVIGIATHGTASAIAGGPVRILIERETVVVPIPPGD